MSREDLNRKILSPILPESIPVSRSIGEIPLGHPFQPALGPGMTHCLLSWKPLEIFSPLIFEELVGHPVPYELPARCPPKAGFPA